MSESSSDSNVCQNQLVFDQAVHHALVKEQSRMSLLAVILWLLFLFWAIYLIDRSIIEPTKRVEHIFFALVAPPVYVIAHYLGTR